MEEATVNASTRWSQWPTAVLVAGALVAGTVIGPTAVQAATAGLVQLEGGGSSHLAKVSSSGQLSVNPGLTQTAAHQILAVQASPSSYVTVIGADNTPGVCTTIYQIPSGHALIITGADFSLGEFTSPPEALNILSGPAAQPCTSLAAFSASEQAQATDNQVFQPGIAIPAGDVIGMEGTANGGVEIYGYLVPAAEVPQHTATAGSGRTSVLPLLGR